MRHLQAEVAQTVEDDAGVDDELRYLLRAPTERRTPARHGDGAGPWRFRGWGSSHLRPPLRLSRLRRASAKVTIHASLPANA
ncbi:MAG: hypothetical protein KA004_16615 [Verrucomicrobiales bacterium]|nr:hypothetical protein [Verrucomicrobiales bacterium]